MSRTYLRIVLIAAVLTVVVVSSALAAGRIDDYLWDGMDNRWIARQIDTTNTYTALASGGSGGFGGFRAARAGGGVDTFAYRDGAWHIESVESAGNYSAIINRTDGMTGFYAARVDGGIDDYLWDGMDNRWIARQVDTTNTYTALASGGSGGFAGFRAARAGGGVDTFAYRDGAWHIESVESAGNYSAIINRADGMTGFYAARVDGVVPEPSSLLALFAGIASCGGIKLRRSSSLPRPREG